MGKNNELKITTHVGLSQKEIAFLDRKTNPKHADLCSRSAILRLLIRRAMEQPALLDV